MAKRTHALGRSLESQEAEYTLFEPMDIANTDCDKCGALAGQWCKTKSGLVAFTPHKWRKEACEIRADELRAVTMHEQLNPPTVPDGVPAYVTVDTIYQVYKIKYTCTHAYPDERAVEGEQDETWVIAKTFDGALYWFEETFNRGGSIFYVDSITHVNREHKVNLAMADYVEGL